MNCSVEEAKVKISDLLGDRIDIAESIANILENEVKDKIVFDTQNVKDQKILGVSLSTIPDRKSYSDNLHINHTGGAYGADSIFSDEFRKYGVVNNHYVPNSNKLSARNKDLDKNGDNIIAVTEEELSLGKKINSHLGNSAHDMNNRNFSQVYNADTVISVASISDGKVIGGTGSAIRIAEYLDKKGYPKEIFILDTNTEKWHKSENGKYIEINYIPAIKNNFAAIGTRSIESYYKNGSYTQKLDNSDKLIEKIKEFAEYNFKEKRIEDKSSGSKNKINIYSSDINGYESLSNLNTDEITIGNNTFANIEALYQYSKAKYFNSEEFANAILSIKNGWNKPSKINKLDKNLTGGFAAQKLGTMLNNSLSNDQKNDWSKISKEKLKKSMKLYYKLNKKGRDLLLSTGDSEFTHNDPTGKINTGRWKKDFPDLLSEVRSEIRNEFQSKNKTSGSEESEQTKSNIENDNLSDAGNKDIESSKEKQKSNIESSEPDIAMTVAEKNISYNKKLSLTEELNILINALTSGSGTSIGGGMIENSQVDRDGYMVSDKDQDIAKAKIEKGQKQISIQDQLPKIEKSKIIQYRKSIEARTKFLSLSNKTIDKINKFMNNHQNNINELEEILSSIKSNVQLAESLGLEPHFKDNNEPLLPFETVKRGSTAKINNNDVKEDGDPFELDIDLADYLHANFSSMYKSEIDEYKDAKKKAAEEGDFTFKTKDMSYEQQMYDVSRMIVENLMENGLNKNLKVRFHRLTEDRYTRGIYTFGEDVGQEVTDPTFVSQGISYTINGGIIDIYYGKGYFDSSYKEVSEFRTDITLSEDYELILHEMLHSMIEKAYDQDKALNRSLFQLKEQVMKKLDYTVLLTKSVEDSTNEEIQLAKDIFEHMDNPTEFLAYASTNRNVFNAIKNMQIKNTLIGEFRPKRGEEIGKFKQLLNKFIQAVNKVYTAMTTGASAKAELDRIYASLLDINTKIETGSLDIRFDKKFRKYEAYGIGDKYKATNDWMLKAEDGILSTAKDIWSSDNIRNKSEAAGRFLENIWSWRRFNWIRDSRLISDLITDITEDTTGEDAAWFYKAVRNTKGNRERDKLDFAAVMKSKVSEQFKDFTEDERSAVTYMLQGDWLALNIDIQEYKNMLENKSIVRARIDELKKMINVPEYANQSAFLGYYMINQEAKGSAMLKNAFQIYYRFHMGKHSSPIQNKYTPEQNIKMIDELASLYAIMYTEKEIKQKIVDSINRDADVVSFASNTYYSYRKDEISGQLSDFAIFTDKGYVRKSSSVNMKFDILPESKIIKNSKFDFLNHKVIRKRDDIKELMDEAGLNPNGEDYYMVVERDTDPARTQGVLDDISIIDTGSEFTSYTAGRNLDFKQVQELREQRFKKDRTHLNSYIDDSLESLRARDNYSVAEFDISGHIDFYSSPISEADKKLYGRSIDDIAEVIGNTTSHISTKEKALLNNQRFIDLLIEDSKRNIGSDGYVFLSPDSGDKELDTYWAMIPDYSRHYIMSSTNEKGIWVKRSRINNIVGYKDPSISNMKLFGLRLEDYPQWQKALKIVEHTWKEISSSYKEIIVKLMPDVVIGNASSNMFIAMRHGIGGIEYAKAFRDAWSELSEYMELNKELIALKIDEKTGVSGIKTKIKELESRLERNGVHPLIKDGQFSMIFEDIDVDIMKKSTHLKDVIMSASEKKFGKEFTENLDEIRQNIYITKDTRGHRAIEKLTLFNDIINKKIIMDKMMQDLEYKTFASEEAKKAAEEDVINYVDQLFVNYSYLTNKYVKWASDLNLILFIKYFLRAGKASLNMMKRQPLGSTIAESIDTFIWNMPDPIDQYMSPVDTLASKIGLSPFEVVLEIISPNIINPFK